MNAVIYARYSSHGQTEQSIEGQLRDCYAFAEREGYKVIGEYIDRALTGKFDNRPDFQRMIKDAEKRQFQFIIVWKLDRFARNRYDSATYKARLKKYGVKVISATENISDNPEGILLEGLLESLAEYYSENLAKHVKRGLHESVLKGTYTGGIPPVGYKVENKKLVIDEAKAPMIRYAFEQYANGVPKKRIIAELNAKGEKNYYGRPLTLSCFQAALRNKKYIGVYTYNGEEVTGGCPPLIDKATFYAVQEKLKAVSHAPAANKARQRYLLQGKAYCGMCGAPLVSETGTSKQGNVYFYYSCGNRKKHHTCDKLNEKKAFLEWYVTEQTVEYVLTPVHMEYIASRIVAAYDTEFNAARIKEMEGRIMRIDGEVNRLIDTLIDCAPKATAKITAKIEDLETQKLDLEIDLAKLRVANDIRYTEGQIIGWMKTFCKGELPDIEFQERIIDVFINSVYLYDDRMVIYYNIKDGKQISYIDMIKSTEELSFGGDPGLCNGVQFSNEPARHLVLIRTLD